MNATFSFNLTTIIENNFNKTAKYYLDIRQYDIILRYFT